ncbi:MAG: hypothetical protein KJO07_09790, partial [Deltaproteobacteria bacterium]|nr:hypothetical protein [Deltaproteobacteria bacterium]
MKLLRATLYSAFALAISACSLEGDPVLASAGDGKADSPTESRAGRFVTTMIPLQDGCNMRMEVEAAELVDVELAADGNTFVLSTDGDDASCAIDEDGLFECEFEQPATPLLDSVTLTLAGSFDGNDRFEATMSTAIECEGTECDELAMIFDGVELPCTTSASVVGTRALADDFEVEAGDYVITVSPPVEGVSTCQSDTLGALPDVVAIDTNDDGFTLDDGLGLFECFLDEGGAIECDRIVEVPGLEFSSVAAGAFTDQNNVVGALQVDVSCTGTDEECAMA